MTRLNILKMALSALMVMLTLATPVSAQTKKTTAAKKTATTKKTTTATKQTVAKQKTAEQLKKEKAQLQQQKKLANKRAAELAKSIKSNLDSVLILDNKIGKQQVVIDSLNVEVHALTVNIDSLSNEMERLENQLQLKKRRYAKSVVKMRQNRSVHNKMMFLLSADNFAQMMRRMRYLREYSTFQRAQGELVKEKQLEVNKTKNELLDAKAKKETNLVTMREKQTNMEHMRTDCQTKVTFLNKNLANVQQQIKTYQKRERDLNAEIDRMVQIELDQVAKANEARNKAAAEKAKKLAEAKAAKAAAEKAAKAAKTSAEKAAAKAALAKASEEVKEAEKEEKAERVKMEEWKSGNGEVKLSSNFASNKGKLPMPVTGPYSVVGHYGTYTVAGLKDVTLNNNGIDIRGNEGCNARAVFDGVVSSIFKFNGRFVVMLRHGSYISVYSGMSSVNVSKGQNVKTKDVLGAVGVDGDGRYILQFQMRNERTRLNPEQWVR